MIGREPEFTLLNQVKLNIVCFTLKHPALTFEIIQEFLSAVRDDKQVFFTPTVYKGVPAVRAAVSNWQTKPKDIAMAYEAIKKVYQQLFQEGKGMPIPEHKSF